MQPTLLTDQQSEMRAAGPGRAMRDQAVPGRVGNPFVGVVEQFEGEPGLGQHLSRIGAQALEAGIANVPPMRTVASADPRLSVGCPAMGKCRFIDLREDGARRAADYSENCVVSVKMCAAQARQLGLNR
jgi:hypothetical protein